MRPNSLASHNAAHVHPRLRRYSPWRRAAVNQRQARRVAGRGRPMSAHISI